MNLSVRNVTCATLALVSLLGVRAALADGQGDPTVASSKDGEYFDADGVPTFKIDGKKVDYYTFMGFIRYGANCLACHGPDGLGSTYAPSLVNAFQHLDYATFLATVAGGKKAVSSSQQLVMPSLGNNKNVMCYIDGIYVYLRARSDGALGRGRPEDHDPKPEAFKQAEDQCMG